MPCNSVKESSINYDVICGSEVERGGFVLPPSPGKVLPDNPVNMGKIHSLTKRFGKLLLKVRRLHFTLHKNECEVCEDWTQKGREDDIIAITQYMCEFFLRQFYSNKKILY